MVPTEINVDDDPSKAIETFLRTELQGPVAELATRSDAVLLDAARFAAEGYGGDLARIQTAAHQLRTSVARFMETADGERSDARPSVRTIRHDLRTPITAILGYGELVAEEARDAGHTNLVTALEGLLASSSRLLTSIDKLASFARDAGPPTERILGGDVVTKLAQPASAANVDATILKRNAGQRDAVGRILVVDDNPSMRDLIARRLMREGHDVVCCASGEEALEETAKGGFDLLMLDLLMPGMDGLEVLRRLKARSASQALPVIVMSALDETEAAVRCIEAGADDYLAKPLDETLLRARIGSSLERKFLRDRESAVLEQLQLEQQRSDALLQNILPMRVVQRLRAGETVIADQFDDVTVLFCDLVGFTALAARLEPAGTLHLLEEIFSGFDALAGENGVEKIKTIGDAYMAVGGIAEPVEKHAERIVAMACRMPAVVKAAEHGAGLDVRIGIHTGPAAGGIIGAKKFFYDVWGDTVNTASRLEASCEPGRIHVSSSTRRAVGDAFAFEERRPIDVQGKGRMQTFYLKPS